MAENQEHLAQLQRTIAELEQHEVGDVVSYPPKRTVEDLIALKPYVTVYGEDFLAAVALIADRRQRLPRVNERFRRDGPGAAGPHRRSRTSWWPWGRP